MVKTKMTPVKPMVPASGRRPVRPIDRQKMVPWMRNILDKNICPGVHYVDKDKNTFEITWKHAAIRNYSPVDGKIFELWAVHTKKYIPSTDTERDMKRWKANFRCALNSLPDVRRIESSSSKGTGAVRRYRFLSSGEVKTPAKKISGNKGRPRRTEAAHHRLESESHVEQCLMSLDTVSEQTELEQTVRLMCFDASSEVDSTDTGGGRPSPERIPNFQMIFDNDNDAEVTEHTSQAHMSGGRMVSNKMIPPAPNFSHQPDTPESQPDSPGSQGLSSDISEEDCLEMMDLGAEEGMIYHPKFWSDEPFANVAAEVELSDDVSGSAELELTQLSACSQFW